VFDPPSHVTEADWLVLLHGVPPPDVVVAVKLLARSEPARRSRAAANRNMSVLRKGQAYRNSGVEGNRTGALIMLFSTDCCRARVQSSELTDDLPT